MNHDEQAAVLSEINELISARATGSHVPIPDLIRNAAQQMPIPMADWTRERTRVLAALSEFRAMVG
jgi:hypothetical protein